MIAVETYGKYITRDCQKITPHGKCRSMLQEGTILIK